MTHLDGFMNLLAKSEHVFTVDVEIRCQREERNLSTHTIVYYLVRFVANGIALTARFNRFGRIIRFEVDEKEGAA